MSIDPQVVALQDWLRAHEDELLADTQTLLRFPSIEGPAEPNAPYGQANRQALDFALARAQEWGMRTKDLEGHLGYADFGTGDALVMSLGHIDVVPVGPGWKHDPFGAEIDGGYIYARGAVDDKGPTMASFYAMRALQKVCPDLGVRFRQAFGCDEESGFGCVKRYMETEEVPTLGIAPDSGWPLYHAEKGILNFLVTGPVPGGEVELLELNGGSRPNIVIDSCSARLRIIGDSRKHVEAALEDAWDRNITFSWEGNELGIFATGKAAHGSRPFDGDSAATRVLRFLRQVLPLPTQRWFDVVFDFTHPGGAGLGISGADDVSDDLTSNLGIVKVEDGQITLLFNIRYPVSFHAEDLRTKAQKRVTAAGFDFTVEIESDSRPLYFPLEHPMVKAITDVYEIESGSRHEPGTMGGGTYARAVPNTVSIGTGWEGDGAAHETDERLAVQNLFRMSRIYAHILYRLAQIAKEGV